MLPRCLARGGAGGRRDRDRRHGIDRPHDRDRPRTSTPPSSKSPGRARSPTPATSPSTPPPATGSSTSTPTRSSSPTTYSASRPSPAARGARRSTSSRPATPASSATAPRSPTTRCASSATARTTASRAGCTSRSRTTCRCYAAGRVEQSSVRVEHYGYLGAVRDAKEKSRRNLDLLKAQQAESPSDAFLHFNLGTEYAVIGDSRLGADRARARVEPGPEPGPGGPRLRAGAAPAPRHRAAQTAAARSEAIARAEEGLDPLPRLHRHGVRRRRSRALALGREDDAIGYWQRCIEMGDAPARFGGVGRRRHLSPPDLAGRAARSPRRARARRRSCSTGASAEHPDVVGVIAPYASALLRSGTPRRRSWPTRSRRASPS